MPLIRASLSPSLIALLCALFSPVLACSTQAPTPSGRTETAPSAEPAVDAKPKPPKPPAVEAKPKPPKPPDSEARPTPSKAPDSEAKPKPSAAPESDAKPKPSKAPDSETATIYLLALDGQPSWQRARGVSGAAIVGCNDYLVPVTVNISGATPEARAAAALNKLLSLTEADLKGFGYQSGFSPSMLKVSVERKADGKLVIDLKGTLTAGGTCAVPRMKSQIERTAAQFGRVSILVNGSEAQWRCFGDESGNCK